jgi:Bacterial capsule synthesis protein PGA_cap
LDVEVTDRGAEPGQPVSRPVTPSDSEPDAQAPGGAVGAAIGRSPVPQPRPAEPQVIFTVPGSAEVHPAAPNLVAVSAEGDQEQGATRTGLPGRVEAAALRDWLAERPSRLAGIVSTEPPPATRNRLHTRTGLLVMAVVGLLAAGLATGAIMTSGDGKSAAAPPEPPPVPTSPSLPAATASAGPSAGGAAAGSDATISLSATGDIIMGAAPNSLPPSGARTFFADVKGALQADLPMGNLEQPLTNDTGVTKCPTPSPGPGGAPTKQTCFAFRSPPGYAEVLKDAGFKVLNLANNHAYDFGAEGNRQTRAALAVAGVGSTGAPGQITVVDVKGVKVAVLGFSSYPWSQSVVDIDAAAALVRRAKQQADLVVIQMHVGAEGADRTHVRPGTELFLGENRGDSIKFAHAVVDAGADLVVGHGPHVMRAMEFYRGRLIAYSLGNFAGYKALGYSGVVGVGGVLKVSLHKDGSFAGGTLVPTRMAAPGLPALDPARQALSLVRGLSAADLPATGARIGDDGSIAPQS